MEKLVYVVWKRPELSAEQLRTSMLGEVTEQLAGKALPDFGTVALLEYARPTRLFRFMAGANYDEKEGVVAINQVHHSTEHPSHIVLPVVVGRGD